MDPAARKVPVNVNFDLELLGEIDERRGDANRSEFVRMMVKQWLDEHAGKEVGHGAPTRREGRPQRKRAADTEEAPSLVAEMERRRADPENATRIPLEQVWREVGA